MLKGNEGWHTDSTYMPLAAKAGMLMALVVPPEGGETEFADMRAAYDELDDATKEQLEGLSAYHSLYHSQSKLGYTHTTDNQYGFHDKGAPLRPVIKTHPETGQEVALHRTTCLRDPGDERRRVGKAAHQAAGRRLPAAAHVPAFVDGWRPRGLGQTAV